MSNNSFGKFDFSFKTIHIYILKINSVVKHESSTSRLYKIVHNIFQNVKILAIIKISLTNKVSLGFRPNSTPKVGKRRLKQPRIAPG